MSEETIEEIELKFAEVPVKLRDANGNVRTYTIREFDGKTRDDYNADIGKRFELTPEGKVGKILDFRGMESFLLSKCLYDEKGKLVDISIIEAWPDSARKKLHAKAAKVNGLDDKAEEQAKNG